MKSLLIDITYLALGVLVIGCMTMRVPRMKQTDDGIKISATETQEVDQEELDMYIADVMEANGWEKPDVETEQNLRDRWITLMTWAACITVALLVVWYVTHLREAGGAAMIMGIASLVAGGFAATVEYFWIIGVCTMAFVACVAIGFMVKDWHILPSKRKRKQDE